MRISYWIPAVLLLLAACDARRTEQRPPPAAPAVPAAPKVAAPAAGPRAFYQPLVSHDTASAPRFQPVDVDGQRYQLYTSAAVDSTQPLQRIYRNRVNDVDDAGREVHLTRIDTSRGYEVRYRFRLRDATGRPVFDQTLRKTRELAAALGEDFVIDTEAFRPEYLGFLPAFNALAFLVGFGPDGTDVGGDLLLLLDARTGRLRHAGVSRWFLAAHNEAPLLSADGQALLTSYELLRADGVVVKFDRPDGSVAGSAWLSDQAVLVAYTPAYDSLNGRPPLRTPNHVVLDRQGRQLAAFNFGSVEEVGLGYNLLHQYAPATRTHYLYDVEAGLLCLIPRAQPATHRVQKLRQLPRFRPPQRPTEVRIAFEQEFGGSLMLFADTIGGQLRYQLKKPVL